MISWYPAERRGLHGERRLSAPPRRRRTNITESIEVSTYGDMEGKHPAHALMSTGQTLTSTAPVLLQAGQSVCVSLQSTHVETQASNIPK